MKGCVKQALTELQHAHSGRFHPAPSRMATPNFGADRKAHRRFARNQNPVLCLSETKMNAGLSVLSVLWQNPTTLVSTSGREKPAVGGEQMPGSTTMQPRTCRQQTGLSFDPLVVRTGVSAFFPHESFLPGNQAMLAPLMIHSLHFKHFKHFFECNFDHVVDEVCRSIKAANRVKGDLHPAVSGGAGTVSPSPCHRE